MPAKTFPPPREAAHAGGGKQVPSGGGGKRKPPKRRLTWIKEIRRLQKKTEPVISRLTFARCVRASSMKDDVMVQNHGPPRFEQGAILALQEAGEAFMVSYMEDACLLAIHRQRVTVQTKDIKLAQRIRGDLPRYSFEAIEGTNLRGMTFADDETQAMIAALRNPPEASNSAK